MSIDREKLYKLIQSAYDETMSELGDEFTAVIEDENAFQGFPNQDIIDQGDFKESQEERKEGRFSTVFNWDPINEENGYHYAAGLHTGFWAWGRTYIPGRNWTGLGIQRNKPVLNLAEKLRGYGFKVRVYDNTSNL